MCVTSFDRQDCGGAATSVRCRSRPLYPGSALAGDIYLRIADHDRVKSPRRRPALVGRRPRA